MKNYLLILLTVVSVYGCWGNKDNKANTNIDSLNVDISERHDSPLNQHPDSSGTRVTDLTGADKDSVLMGLTKEVLLLMKNKHYAQLDTFVHPESGIRFSPYATIDAGKDKKFSKEEFANLFTKNKLKKYTWGSYDGSGDPIVLTATEYFRKFVYDANFFQADKARVNKMIGNGNSVNNLEAVYNGTDFTESYFGGSKKYGGIDWKSVRLVWKAYNGKYYLVGIVHDGWTI